MSKLTMDFAQRMMDAANALPTDEVNNKRYVELCRAADAVSNEVLYGEEVPMFTKQEIETNPAIDPLLAQTSKVIQTWQMKEQLLENRTKAQQMLTYN